MKKYIIVNLTFLLFISILISGCGNGGIKAEKALQEDLENHGSFYTVEGTEINNLTIIKRMTDKKAKTDDVYVSVEMNHADATEFRAYVMHYLKYNKGWLLDSMEPYYGSEIIWSTIPKTAPTEERVIKELEDYNNNLLAEYYNTTIYMFGEGDIFWENLKTVEDADYNKYQCAAEITEWINTDNYRDEIIFLEFYFDTYTYACVLLGKHAAGMVCRRVKPPARGFRC